MGCCVSLYSAHEVRCQAQGARIYGDRHFLVLWSGYGGSRRNHSSFARDTSRWPLGSQSDSVQAASAFGPHRRNSVSSAGRGPHHGGSRVVPTPPLGMEIRSRNHRHTGCRGYRELRQGRLPARRYWRNHRGRIVAVSFAIKYQSRVHLESLSKKFEQDITA